jgi:phosphatidylinositol alpha-1,6-mannosyltransferase
MVTSSFLPGQGGIETYLAELCALAAPDIAVIAPPSRDGKPLPSGLQYETIPFRRRTPLPDKQAAQGVIEAARYLGVNKVLIGTPWPFVLIGPHLKRAGLSYAVIVHGAEFLTPAAVPFLRRKLASSMAAADLLLPVSGFTATKLATFLREASKRVPPIEVMYARVDTDRFEPTSDRRSLRTKLGLPPAEKMILCFGRLVPRKGVHRLIEALPRVQTRVPGTVVVVAGTGPETERLKRLAAPLGDSVIFTGRVPDADAPKVYAAADVFCLPVIDRWFGLEIEGLGVVLLEAAASGTPAVTGRSGGTPEAVIDGTTGFVVDAGDPAALAEKLTTLLSDDGLSLKMGAAAREHVLNTFSGQEVHTSLAGWLHSES